MTAFVRSTDDEPNVLRDPALAPSKLTEEQLNAVIMAQRNYGVSLSHTLLDRFQTALAEWAADINAKGEPLPAISSFYAMAAAAAMTVNLLSLQVRANGGFDDDAIGRWFQEVGNMAASLLAKYSDPEYRAEHLHIAGTATPEVVAQLRENPDRAEDQGQCAQLVQQQKEHLDAIVEGIRSGKLVGTVGHA
jgi:hypothetical protein